MLKIEEFHFLRKRDSFLFFDTFCFKPTLKKEKEKGFFFILIETKFPLIKPRKFFNNLVKSASLAYYSSNFSPRKSFNLACQRANQLLENSREKENLIGNFNSAIFAITQKKELFFSLSGKTKFILIRNGNLFELDKKLLLEKSPFFDFFSNLVQGKLEKEDIILAISENLYNYLENQNFIEQIITAKNQREIRKTFKKSFPKTANGCAIFIRNKKSILLKRDFFLQDSFSTLGKKLFWFILAPKNRKEKVIVAILILLFLFILAKFLF